MRGIVAVLWLALLSAGCGGAPQAVPRAATAGLEVDTARLMHDLRVLAADSLEGRRTGTTGIERARRFLLQRFAEIGLAPVGGPEFGHPFRANARSGEAIQGVNLLGLVRGTTAPDTYLVVTAHYDHLGMRDGVVFNGADDNASGTAALLELARQFVRQPPRHSIIFAALDAEEQGLRGAEALLRQPPVPRAAIALNVNLDMVGRSVRNELFAAGTYHTPRLRRLLEQVEAAPPVRLRFGHDSPDLPPADDWTLQSDHGAFHRAGIPFVYFGVEDHPDYHRPSDDAERIEPLFFGGAVATVFRAIQLLDAELGALPGGG